MEKVIAGPMRELMDDVGLTGRLLIEKHLIPLLDATETKFFPWRKVTKHKTEQIIDEREVAALGTQIQALVGREGHRKRANSHGLWLSVAERYC